MVEKEKEHKEHKFTAVLKDGFNYISKLLIGNILSPLVEGVENIMNNIDDRIKKIEKRVFRKVLSFLVIGLGVLFLIFALFFFLKEYLLWNNTLSFFSIGIVVFVTGLLLKIGERDR